MRRKSRAKNLSASDIAIIVTLIKRWRGALRWSDLIDAVKDQLGETYTRQALGRQEKIANALRVRRQAPLDVQLTVEQEAEKARAERDGAEIKRLRTVVSGYKELFALFVYNARLRGVTEAELRMPLDPIDRDRTVLKPERRNPLKGL